MPSSCELWCTNHKMKRVANNVVHLSIVLDSSAS